MRTVGNQFQHNVGIGEEKRKNWRVSRRGTLPKKKQILHLKRVEKEEVPRAEAALGMTPPLVN